MSSSRLTVPGEARDESLSLLYEEAQRAVDRQIDTVESLNNRAGALVALSGVILSVVAAVDPTDEPRSVRIILAAATGTFIFSALLAALAWQVRRYRDDPYMTRENVKRLLGRDGRHLRAQILSNRLASIQQNITIIDEKRDDLRLAMGALLFGFGMIVAAIMIRLWTG